jgi:putative ABC transport system permease protein
MSHATLTGNRTAGDMNDLRYAFRMLIKNGMATVFAVLALGIGIGANSTIFSMANSLLLSPWPFSDPNRIMRIGEKRVGKPIDNLSISGLNYLEWKDQCQSFVATCLITVRHFNLTGDAGRPEEVAAYVWSPSAKDVFRAPQPVALGRPFLPEDDRPGKEQVVLLTHGLWSQRFGADPQILGKPVYLDGRAYTVVGVLPASSSVFEAEARLWIPLPIEELRKGRREDRDYVAFGLLKPGVSKEQAQAEMTVISRNLARQHQENAKWEIALEPMIENLLRAMRQTMLVLHGAVGFVLLIACSIVASLLLARATARQKEVSIRLALGATRRQVLRQMLTESVLLALCGGAFGLLLTSLGIQFLKSMLPPVLMDFVTRQGIDARLLGFTLILSIATGLLFGMVPALRASKVDLTGTLKEGGRGSSGGPGSHRWLRLLVVSEIALSLILLVGAGLMINSFLQLQRVDPGFRAEGLLTFHVTLRGSRYESDPQRRAYYQEIVGRIERLPGVESVAAANVLPMNWGSSVRLQVDGQSDQPDGEPYSGELRSVGLGYFKALGIPLKRGRYFLPEEDRDGSRRVLVNEALARKIWPNQDPVGRLLTMPDWSTLAYEVVGVVGDVRHFGLNNDPSPTLYVPFMDRPAQSVSLALRTKGDPLRLLPSVREVVRALDPEVPVIRPRTMTAAIAESVAMNRFGTVFLSMLSVVALVLSSLGIYGIMAYSVSQRTHEIGIRVALGAQVGDVVGMALRQGIWLTLVGVAIGLGGAFVLMRVLASLLTGGVSATDPATFAGTTLLLIGVSLLASYIPARRSARVDPVITLRAE